MLDYAPDDTARIGAGQKLALVWKNTAVLDNHALLQIIATSRAASVSSETMSPPGTGPRQSAFHPERVAGFCASC